MKEFPIRIIRAPGSVLLKCSVCGPLEASDLGVEIDFNTKDVTLCRKHEAELLERLLINYCKRSRKRVANGKKPDYWVTKPPEECPCHECQEKG